MAKDRMDALTEAAARVAVGLPGAEEGIACAGTAIESRTYKVNGKAFVFVRPSNVMLKLGPSLAEAATIAKTATPPGSLKAGAGGWVTITNGGAGLSVSVMTRWVKESQGLFTVGSDKAGKAGKKAIKKVARKVGKKAVKKAARKKTVKKSAKVAEAVKPVSAKLKLLSGGNPQVAKADGDTPVHSYIAAMPGWKHDVGSRLDALIVRTVPNARKAVRWNSPFYGVEDQGWFLSYHCFAKYVKVSFLNGASLSPLPPVESKHEDVRYFHIHEDDQLDERLVASWIKQASKLPGDEFF